VTELHDTTAGFEESQVSEPASATWLSRLTDSRLTAHLGLIARFVIGGIFIYASVSKIGNPAAFAEDIRNYMLLPEAWSNVLAMTLPWIELGAAAFLILGVQTRASALLTTGMLTVFLAAIVYAYSIGLDIHCGCFGSASASAGRIGIWHILRDAALVLISLFILVTDRGAFRVAGLLAKSKASNW
jgi:uncharacterized membrane protein YphA (DoxX/SURF4 family)